MRVSLCCKDNNMQKQLLRRATDGGPVVELDGEVDEVHGEGAYVDCVGVGDPISVAGEEVLDVFLCRGRRVQFAGLLQCEQNTDTGKVDRGCVARDGHCVLARLHLTHRVREVQDGDCAYNEGATEINRLASGGHGARS